MKHIARIFISVCLLAAACLLAAEIGGRVMAAEKSEEPTYLVIQFDVRMERLAEFTDIMMGVKQAMQTEEGFQDAFVLRGLDAPGQFILVERWQSKELHLEHFDRIVASGEWQNIRGMLNSAPVMQYTTQLAH